MCKSQFPVISGGNVNAGVATVGSDIFTIEIDEVDPVASGATPVPVNLNSFEINGELYTITPGQNGTDYSACKVVGAGKPPVAFTGPNTFQAERPGHYVHASFGPGWATSNYHRELSDSPQQRPDLGCRRGLRHHVCHRYQRLA